MNCFCYQERQGAPILIAQVKQMRGIPASDELTAAVTSSRAGHGGLMTPSSPALDRQRLTQNAVLRCGVVDDSAQRKGGRMRDADDADDLMEGSRPQKKR